MNAQTSVVTARLDAETLAGLEKLAAYHDRSRAWLIAKAVKRYVKEEAEFFAFLQEGEDDFARGDYITHDELVARLRNRIDQQDEA